MAQARARILSLPVWLGAKLSKRPEPERARRYAHFPGHQCLYHLALLSCSCQRNPVGVFGYVMRPVEPVEADRRLGEAYVGGRVKGECPPVCVVSCAPPQRAG